MSLLVITKLNAEKSYVSVIVGDILLLYGNIFKVQIDFLYVHQFISYCSIIYNHYYIVIYFWLR